MRFGRVASVQHVAKFYTIRGKTLKLKKSANNERRDLAADWVHIFMKAIPLSWKKRIIITKVFHGWREK